MKKHPQFYFSIILIVTISLLFGIFLNQKIKHSEYLQNIQEAISCLEDSIELLSSLNSDKMETLYFLNHEKASVQSTIYSLNLVIYNVDSSLLPISIPNYFFVKNLHDKNIAELKQVKVNMKEIETHITNLESFIKLNPDKTDQIKQSIYLINEAIRVNLEKLGEINQTFKTIHHLELDNKINVENSLKDSSQAINNQISSVSS